MLQKSNLWHSPPDGRQIPQTPETDELPSRKSETETENNKSYI